MDRNKVFVRYFGFSGRSPKDLSDRNSCSTFLSNQTAYFYLYFIVGNLQANFGLRCSFQFLRCLTRE